MEPLLYNDIAMDLTPEVQDEGAVTLRGLTDARTALRTRHIVTLVYEPGDRTRYRLRVIYYRLTRHLRVQWHTSWGPLDVDTVRAEYMYSLDQLTQAVIPLPVWQGRMDTRTERPIDAWTAQVIERAMYDLFSTEGGANVFPR